MSDIFELDQDGWQSRIADAQASGFDANQALEPGFFEGALSAGFQGVMRGGAKTADLMGTVGRMFTPPAATDEEEILRDQRMQAADELQDELRTSALDFWTPNAHTTGTAGKVLGGLGEMVLPLMAGAGNPSLLIGSQTLGTGKELIDEGVDANTAATVGAVEGLGTYAGFKLPFLGKTLASKMATGAGGNLLLGGGLTAADRAVLDSRGYADLAKQYDPLDATSRTVDLLTGLAFGGLAHHQSRLSPSQRNAVLAAANAKHFQADTAPGIPQDAAASVAHQRAMETALTQVLNGEPVAVSPEIAAANFAPRAAREAMDDATWREVFGEEMPKAPDLAEASGLRDENIEIATRARESVKPEEGVAEEGGYDVAEGAMTDEQIAAFQGLRSDVQADQNVDGSGAREPGESGDQGDGGARSGEPLRVYRGASRELTPKDFQPEALGFATEHPSSGLGVFFTNTADNAAQYGKVSEHHLDIRNPKVVKVEDFPGLDSLDDYRALAEKLKAEGHDGMVIDASHLDGPVNYVAFAPEQVIRAKPSEGGDVANAGKTPAQEPAAADGNSPERLTSPVIDSVRAQLAEQDVPISTGAIDAEGNTVTRSGREIMAEAEAAYQKAQEDAKGIEAAVSCFLTRGTDAT